MPGVHRKDAGSPPSKCNAKSETACPYGNSQQYPEAQHYASMEEAQAAYEADMEEAAGSRTLGSAKPKARSKKVPVSAEYRDYINEQFDGDTTIDTATPVEADTVLGRARAQRSKANDDREHAVMRYAVTKSDMDHREDPEGVAERLRNATGLDKYDQKAQDELKDADARYERSQAVIEAVASKRKTQGEWTRAYLVNKPGGHVHSSTQCGTLNREGKPTQVGLLPEYSGSSEDDIVKDAGYRACTRCYPDAPVGNAQTLPSAMLTEQEREKQKRKTEAEAKTEAKKAAAASKAPTADGTPLKVGSDTYKTERSAEQGYLDRYTSALEGGRRAEEHKTEARTIAASLAAKRGVPEEQVHRELAEKVKKRMARDEKAWEEATRTRDRYIVTENGTDEEVEAYIEANRTTYRDLF